MISIHFANQARQSTTGHRITWHSATTKHALRIHRSTLPTLPTEVEIAPAILEIINIILNYAHSCVSVASRDRGKQRDSLRNTRLTSLVDQLGLQILDRRGKNRLICNLNTDQDCSISRDSVYKHLSVR